QLVLLAVQLLDLNEQLSRAMLGLNDPQALRRDACGEQQHAGELDQLLLHAACSTGCRSAMRRRALRERGLRSTSSSVGRTSLPISFSLGRAKGGTFGNPA